MFLLSFRNISGPCKEIFHDFYQDFLRTLFEFFGTPVRVVAVVTAVAILTVVRVVILVTVVTVLPVL